MRICMIGFMEIHPRDAGRVVDAIRLTGRNSSAKDEKGDQDFAKGTVISCLEFMKPQKTGTKKKAGSREGSPPGMLEN